MTKLIIVRHCQAEGNLKRFFQGTIETDITPLGALQIEQTAKLLSNEPIDVIYVSPQKRALKTAEGINLYHEVEMRIHPGIVEIDAGAWEGVLLTDIEKRFPEQFYNWRNAPEKFEAPGGETMAQVYERVKKALLEIIEANKGRTVCVVSHGCAIKNMMCFAHGWELTRIGEVPLGTNTSVNVVGFSDELEPRIIIENYTDHLQNDSLMI